MAVTYKDAGVDVAKGDAFVDLIKGMVRQTYNPNVQSGVGGFAALYKLGEDRYLAAGTDGVGTKLKLAQQLDQHETIGIDLVAMCVNDVLCTGARPLFFLDYLATGKLELAKHAEVVKGIVAGCKQAGAALIGGETAEMPGMYQNGEYDLAGFCVGEVSSQDLLDGSRLKPGDTLIGLASSGFHSNGYSLVRKLVKENETELLQSCLQPTVIYVQAILKLLEQFGDSIKGLAHITGGGLENIPRMNPALGYEITSLPEPPAFMQKVCQRSGLGQNELIQTFNMGVGLVVATDKPAEVLAFLKPFHEGQVLGKVVSGYQGLRAL